MNAHLFASYYGLDYIGPTRATGERYYRLQDLQVKGITHDGSNVATYLKSLKNSKHHSFSQWLKSTLDTEVVIREANGHVTIFLKNGNKEINIADSGFGFSQILPISILLWKTIHDPAPPLSHDSSHIIAIEQPELHLHPAHQTRLADMFATFVKQ